MTETTLRRYAFNFYRSNEYWDEPQVILLELDDDDADAIRAMIDTCRQFLRSLPDTMSTVYTGLPGGNRACVSSEGAEDWDWLDEIPDYMSGPLEVTGKEEVPRIDDLEWPHLARVERWELRISLDSVWLTCSSKDSSDYLETELPEGIVARAAPAALPHE